MADPDWRDRIVGDRMRVDQAFAPRVRESGFSNQEWSLIMTAVRLELDGDGEWTTLVADTSRLPAIVPELDRIESELGALGGGRSTRGGGFLASLRSTLGLGNASGVDAATVREAEALASAYAEQLEAHLRETGRWERVVETE